MLYPLRQTLTRGFLSAVCVASLLLCAVPVARVHAYTQQYMQTNPAVAVRWYTPTITVALSSSLSTPPANFRGGSDLRGAAQRALARWSAVANINFNVVDSPNVDVNQHDGVNLITVAATATNINQFINNSEIGRAFVAYSRTNGAITDADIALSPVPTNNFDPNHPRQFATDGARGYYDAEEVFVHEIGHLLGLDHTGNIAASMRPYTVHNDDYFTGLTGGRTLSPDDMLGVQAMYGARQSSSNANTGLSGYVTNLAGGALVGAHVWLEQPLTGLTVGNGITLADGSYKIVGLSPGKYRVRIDSLDAPVSNYDVAYVPEATPAFRAYELNATATATTKTRRTLRRSVRGSSVTAASVADDGVTVTADIITRRDFQINAQSPTVNMQAIGVFEGGYFGIGYAAVPFTPGTTKTVLIAGAGLLNLLPGAGGEVSVTSPFATVSNVQHLAYAVIDNQTVPILSATVTVSATAPVGDYALRGQTANGELVFQSGAIAVEPAGTLALKTANSETESSTALALLKQSTAAIAPLAVLDFTRRPATCVELHETESTITPEAIED